MGGPHFYAETLNADSVSVNYLFAGDKIDVLNIKSVYPLFYFKKRSSLQKFLQYVLNTFLIWFYFIFKIPRASNVIIHSIKNYPAIFAFLLSLKKNVILIIHEEQSKLDSLVLRIVMFVHKYKIVKSLSIYSVASSIVHERLRNEIKLMRYSVPEKEKSLLSNAYADHSSSSDRRIKLLLIGNISPVKNYAHFLSLLRDINSDVDVYLYGGRTGSELYLKAFDTAVSDFEKSGNRLIFMGFTKKEDIWNTLSKYDIFCLPSVSEAAPLVLYEMRETGIPILYSDVGDCREILVGYSKARSMNVSVMSSQFLESTLHELKNMNVR